MRGYDYQELSPLFVKRIFKKSIYENLSIDQCMQLLSRGHMLEFKQAALEKLELYILSRIINDPEETANFNENRLQFYLEACARRRRLSLIQIQTVLKLIDHFFEKATEPGS